MSVTYGFYNSKDHDRKYDAIQMSSIFDGIIRDGIYQHIGTAMMVTASSNMMVQVGIGRAWFNHTWTLNDALLPLTVPQSEVILNRIDAVVLEVDSREEIRANCIKIIKGTPSSNPSKPTMVKTEDRWQYPLAYIRVDAGVTSIRQADITNCVGTSECPFVTAPLEKMNIDSLIAQWGDQWKKFYETSDASFDVWFQSMRDQLSTDAAGNLQLQMDGKLDKSGGTMTGGLFLPSDAPTEDLQAATKKYVDDIAAGKADAVHTHAAGDITSGVIPIEQGGTGNANGQAASAVKLANARTVRTNLASTATASFDGSANITPGVTGTLGIGNGGTGATTAASALSNLGGLAKSGGTMTGALYAQNNTSYATAQVRNIICSTSDLTAGTSALANGTLYFVYE